MQRKKRQNILCTLFSAKRWSCNNVFQNPSKGNWENYASSRISSRRFGVPNPLFFFVVKINKNFFDYCYRAMYNEFFSKSYFGFNSECKSVFKYQITIFAFDSQPSYTTFVRLIFGYMFKRFALFHLHDKYVSNTLCAIT